MSVMSRTPFMWTLPSSLKTLYVADLNKDDEAQRRSAFQLIADAAQRGDNVGVDEFTEEWFDMMLRYSEVAVTLREPGKLSGCLLGFLVVKQSRFCRSANPDTCQLLVFAGKELGGRHILRDLVRLGTTLVGEARRLYVACVAEVFAPCLDHVWAFRDERFIITACIPEAGLLAGRSDHCDSYIMYRELDRRSDVHTSMLSTSNDDDEEEDIPFTLLELPDYVPFRYDLDGGRTQIIVRALRRDEVRDFYTAIQAAADTGTGFGFDELPGLSYFIRFYVSDSYNIVYELATTAPSSTSSPEESSSKSGSETKRTVIGYSNVGPTPYSRSRKKAVLLDAVVVFWPEYRRRGWWRDSIQIHLGIIRDCGVRYYFADCNIDNMPAIETSRRIGAKSCGSVPRNVYVAGEGWVDSILLIKPLSEEEYSFRLRLSKSQVSKI